LKAYSSKVVKTRQGTDVNLPATDYHKIKNYTFDTAVNTGYLCASQNRACQSCHPPTKPQPPQPALY